MQINLCIDFHVRGKSSRVKSINKRRSEEATANETLLQSDESENFY